ncbi:unnamed protein product [Polarella glacialis]|uniref:Uncharacterized protein n=1 Tax=Polarella glacialis TaxID=89957 RepID=A0A813EJH6_POLGL|nr:unnamed protein product [Polarella glacialis]
MCIAVGFRAARDLSAASRAHGDGVRSALPALYLEMPPQFYVCGGCSSGVELALVERFDLTSGLWTTMPPMPTARRWCGAAALRGMVYVVGGHLEGEVSDAVERYNVSAGMWEVMPALPTAREACAVAVSGGRLYVLGGSRNEEALLASERFYPDELGFSDGPEWEKLSDMPAARDACCVATVGGRIFVLGGRDGTRFLASGDVLQVSQGSWSPLPPMSTARLGSSAVAFGTNQIFVFGGHGESGEALASVERFDASLYIWEQIVPLPTARLGCLALCGSVAATSGYICIFGGHDGTGASTAADRLEVEDKSSLTDFRWTTLPPLRTPRYACGGASVAW